MNVTTRNHVDTGKPVSAPGPGVLLRDAREAAGLSLAEVASKLHLDLKVVNALEEDDFSALPTATFVRGYLRSYTQLLGVPTGPVLEALDNERLSPPVLIPDIAEAPEASSDDIPVRLVSYGVIAALTIMVVLWWNNQNFNYQDLIQPAGEIESSDSAGTAADDRGGPEAPVEEPAAAPEAQDTASEPPRVDSDRPEISVPVATVGTTAAESIPSVEPAIAPTAPPGSSLDEQLHQAEQSIETTQDVLLQSEALISTPETPAAVESAAGTQAPEPESANAPATQQSTDAATAQAAPVPDSVAEPGPVAGGEDTLSMHFTRESWVTVYDHNDKRLFYNLARPDQTVEVSGPGPLRVLLGRPQGVTVLYNGKAMALDPYISSSGIARFTGNP